MTPLLNSDQNPDPSEHQRTEPDQAAAASDDLGRDNRIHFATGTGMEGKGLPGSLGIATQITAWGVIGTLYVVLLVLAFLSTLIYHKLGVVPLQIFGAVVGVAVLFGVVRWLWPMARRSYMDNMELDKLPMTSNPARRVCCVGSQAAIRRLLPITSDPFEPVIVRLLFAANSGSAFIWTWIAASLGSVGLIYLISIAPGIKMTLGPVSIWSFGYFVFAFAGFFGALVAAAIFPTYLRIVPGRVDVLKFGLLGRGVRSLETFNVREDRVEVALKVGAAIVQEYTPEPRAHGAAVARRAIIFAGSFERAKLARAILAAAVSEHPTPPLPDDALVG
jgi:hypothetical protein